MMILQLLYTNGRFMVKPSYNVTETEQIQIETEQRKDLDNGFWKTKSTNKQ